MPILMTTAHEDEQVRTRALAQGAIGFFLKPFDPLFREKGKGAVLPITITGPREKPKFGLEWGKVLK